MRSLYYICAQPATYYYSWQVDAMLLSFKKNGNVELNKVHVVSSIPRTGAGADEHFLKVADKWSNQGVLFEFYKDTRNDYSYISSIRPHLLKKHWEKHPWLVWQDIFYHDCDIALTKPLKLDDKLSSADNKTCFLSDTKSYIGGKYISSKGHDILQDMCDIVGGITPDEVINREEEAGGAQYLIKPGLNADFWQAVYDDSEQLYKRISKKWNRIKRETPNWHEIQIWCADMWAVLWNLWKLGYKTPINEDLDFTWGTQVAAQWDKNAIFHNAGVVKETPGEPFYKSAYVGNSPITAPRPNDKWASQKYYDLVVDAWNETSNTNQPRIILIGNGTSVLDQPLGHLIDQFDIVVRFNSFKQTGLEQFTGTKLHTWFTCNTHHKANMSQFDQVLVHTWADPAECKIWQQLVALYPECKRVAKDKLVPQTGLKAPSTGLIAIHHFLEQADQIWLHGFDWWERTEHHYADNESRGTIHQPAAELDVINRLGNRIQWLNRAPNTTPHS